MSVAILAFPVMACIMIEAMYVEYASSPSLVPGCCEITNENQPLYQEVRFSSEDGIMLSGWYAPPRNGAVVILLHGYGADRREMEGRAGALAEDGFGVLLYDLRGHGRSEGAFRALGWLDVPDLHAALNFLQQQELAVPPRIGVFGFSIGGQIAIRGAAADTRIRALCLDDPGYASMEDLPKPRSLEEGLLYGLTWMDMHLISLRTGIPIPQSVSSLLPSLASRPLMFILSGKDDVTLHFGYGLYGQAREPKQKWEIPDAGHGQGFQLHPEEYILQLTGFFRSTLLDHP